jgi:hypothetical protein
VNTQMERISGSVREIHSVRRMTRTMSLAPETDIEGDVDDHNSETDQA